MPVVPQYGNGTPQVAASAMPSIQASNPLTTEMATTGARQLEKFGAALGQVASALNQVEVKAQQQEDDATVKRVFAEKAKDINAVRLNFQSLQGVEANADQEKYHAEMMGEIAKSAEEGLANDRQRLMFSSAISSMMVSNSAQMTGHRYHQMGVARVQEAQGVAKVHADNLVGLRGQRDVEGPANGDLTVYAQNERALAAAIADANPGAPQSVLDIKVRDYKDANVHIPSLSAMVDDGQTAQAKDYYLKMASTMSPVARAQAENIVHAAGVRDTSYRLWSAGETPQSVKRMTDDNKITPEVHDAFMQRYRAAEIGKHQSMAMASANTRESTAAWIDQNPRMGFHDAPAWLQNSINRTNNRSFFDKYAQGRQDADADPAEANALLGMSINDPVGFSQVDLSEAAVTRKQQQHLEKLQAEITTKGAKAEIGAATLDVMKRNDAILPTEIKIKGKETATQKKARDAFTGSLTGKLSEFTTNNNGVAPTPVQEAAIINGLKAEVAMQRSVLGFGYTSDVPVWKAEAETVTGLREAYYKQHKQYPTAAVEKQMVSNWKAQQAKTP